MKKIFTSIAALALMGSMSAAPQFRLSQHMSEQQPKQLVQHAPVAITDYQTVEFSADEVELVDYTQLMGVFQFVGSKDNGFEAFMAVFSDQIPGHYTWNDMYQDACGIYLDYADYDGVYAADLTADVVETSTGYKCTAIFLGENGVEYTLIFNYGEPEPAPTTLTLSGEMNDYVADRGFFEVTAVDLENKRDFTFHVNANALEAGEYGAEAIDPEHTYVALYSSQAELMDILEYVGGVGTLSFADNTFTWEGSFDMKSELNGQVTTYELTISGSKPSKEGDQYDSAEEGFAGEYAWDSVEYPESASDNVVTLESWSETPDGFWMLVNLEFNVEAKDPEHVLPLGVYTINATHELGTVTSASYTDDIYGSYVATTIYGWIISPLWYMDEGTVTVEQGKDDGLCITIDATNTWGQPINVVIGEKDVTSIKGMESKAAARMVMTPEGLSISKGNKHFNLMGVEIK